MKMHESINLQPIEKKEQFSGMEDAVVFVPGLGESATEIYQDIARGLREDMEVRGKEAKDGSAMPNRKLLIAVSTHPDEESDRQNDISSKTQGEEASSVMSVIVKQDREKHESFSDRVNLVSDAVKEAKNMGAENITLVGHSAGGLAALAAIAREVYKGNQTPEEKKINFHGILVAPAIPGEVGKWVTTEPKFLQVMFGNVLKSVFNKKTSYGASVLKGEDFIPSEKDLRELLGPMKDKGFENSVVEGAVPISGAEGLDLLKYPNVLNKKEKEKWPQNISIDVVIPESDQWVSKDGQSKLVTEVLQPLIGKKAREVNVQGGHLPLGKGDGAMKTVVDLISQKQK